MGNNSAPKFIFRLSRFPVYRGSVLGRFYCTKNKLFTKLVLFTRPVIFSLLAFSIADLVPGNYKFTTKSEPNTYLCLYLYI